MNPHQRRAIENHCRLAGETLQPKFARLLPSGITIVLTVNSGYE
jgi:hypothetical protein